LVWGTLGLCPRPQQGHYAPAPRYWGFAPRVQVFRDFSLLWPCVPIWGYAPKPHARGLAANLLILENQTPDKGVLPQTHGFNLSKNPERCCRPFFGATFPGKRGSAPSGSRGAWGVAPNGNARQKQGTSFKHLPPWGEAPITGCRGHCPLPGFGVEPQRPPPAACS